GDDFAYGFGDLAGLGFSPGLGRHLCKQLRNEKRLKHCWQIYNKGVSRSLSSDWYFIFGFLGPFIHTSSQPRPDSKNYFEQWFLKSRAHDAEVVIIILGFSDVRARYFGRNPISAEETVQNIVGLARVLRNLGKDVWVCPVSCWGDEKAVVEDSLVEENKRRNEILELYLEGWAQRGQNKDGVQAGPWIDGRKFDFKHDGFYYFDGVHFNTKGYEKLAKDFVDILLTSLIKREFNMMKDLLT
ncbi:hypothetical protein DFJ73DRAFT_629288, partial [Zopfochytrium polystomum]